ncbi:MAG: class I SAM-dependent methyltransferase [Pelatocladus maniniholoensis HA4357-MV3]|jgi:SAM-dependent methyltransferase|uniref:Class I SAM-dependent methyltransferase n=1 Tax=Pelatocladus maniniholoensis HA4357-MV3 TaxID=1117104 RepID=A0A9E3H725_9NOST|nr:class I SAM-dependent methyltransferase [Pelatocladus maniniholoensis HA4357-MV3]
MSLLSPIPNYEPFARMQNELKSTDEEIVEGIIPLLEHLVLQHFPKGARILDLGCGSGKLLQQLYLRGYHTTGMDASKELLRYAQINSPESEFILSDIRKFELPPTFDAVLSHIVLLFILNAEELTSVFRNVYTALRDNGLFVFTIPLTDWFHEIAPPIFDHVNVNDECAMIEIFNYKPEERIWEIKVTGFELIENIWKRFDTIWLRRDFFLSEVEAALEKVGFTDINHYRLKDFGSDDDAMACFVCLKQ